MEIIQFNGVDYPKLQAEGFAAQYAFPFAEKICKGDRGLDIGYSKPEWKLPGAIGIDNGKFCSHNGKESRGFGSATNFNPDKLDYIFSSHCLEHVPDWVGVLDYWKSKLKPGGVCFLYLPDCDHQEYWQPMNNRKHINWIRQDMLKAYFNSGGWRNIFITGHDLNYSFYAIAEKI